MPTEAKQPIRDMRPFPSDSDEGMPAMDDLRQLLVEHFSKSNKELVAIIERHREQEKKTGQRIGFDPCECNEEGSSVKSSIKTREDLVNRLVGRPSRALGFDK